jgi:hypothetical protein
MPIVKELARAEAGGGVAEGPRHPISSVIPSATEEGSICSSQSSTGRNCEPCAADRGGGECGPLRAGDAENWMKKLWRAQRLTLFP